MTAKVKSLVWLVEEGTKGLARALEKGGRWWDGENGPVASHVRRADLAIGDDLVDAFGGDT